MNQSITTQMQVKLCKKIRLLVDYRGQFYSSLRVSTGGFDIARLKKRFEELGYELVIQSFCEINPLQSFDSSFVLYQSSEDRDLHYKEYISDWIQYIESRGGVLIPSFNCFRAHENKVFQSLLTQNLDISKLYVPNSQIFGCFEEIEQTPLRLSFPLVIKTSAGCQSQGVTLARSKSELLQKTKRLSNSFHLRDALRFFAKRWLRKGYIPESLHRKKFVLQEFIPALTGDFKVLVFYEKVFVLQRGTRPNDFRASGSGRFAFIREVPSQLLDCAINLRKQFNCPMISADIAFDEKQSRCILIEIQFLMFGTYTLEKSTFHFEHDGKVWKIVEGAVILEDVFAEAVSNFIQNHLGKLRK